MQNAECIMRNWGGARPRQVLRHLAALLSILLLLPRSLFAAPQMPQGFVVAVTNSSGKTWHEIGSLPQPFAMARATLNTSMRAQGYKLVHDIAENDNSKQRLFFWRREDEDVILMIWQEDLYTTGISWGISIGDDAEDEESVLSQDKRGLHNH